MATSTTKAKEARNDRATADIEAELAKLKSDISGLTQALGTYGKTRAHDVENMAAGIPDEVLARSRDALSDMRAEIDALDRRLEARVKTHPLQSVLVALGLGVLLGAIAKR